jgi:hypothetical protein
VFSMTKPGRLDGRDRCFAALSMTKPPLMTMLPLFHLLENDTDIYNGEW